MGARSQANAVLAGHGGIAPMRYDAMVGPDPEEWQALDESEQQEAVLRYHKRE